MEETDDHILIRPVLSSDIKDICSIDRESFPTPWSEESYLSEIDSQGMVFLAALNKNKIVGFITAFSVVDKVHKMKIAVEQRSKRKGLGKRLMKKLEDELNGRQVKIIWLEVRHKNISALKFYTGLGFEAVGVLKKYYSDTGEDAVVMLKEI